MRGRLQGLKIVVPETRELDLFATLLEREGAQSVRCPLVRIVDIDDTSEMDGWIRSLIDRPFDDLVLFTGEGVRRLAKRSERLGVADAFVAALKQTRTIIRGPKPARALKDLGLAPGISAPLPTSAGLIAALAKGDLRSRRVGVQLYPGGGNLLVDALRARGALVQTVTPYRYTSATGSSAVADIIRRLSEGEFGMIAFTSSPQLERLIEVSKERGLEGALIDGLKRVRVAAVGPIVFDALRAMGINDIVQPSGGSFYMKPLVRAIAAAWSGSG
jgi:uroporphyrinogen-III synthase